MLISIGPFKTGAYIYIRALLWLNIVIPTHEPTYIVQCDWFSYQDNATDKVVGVNFCHSFRVDNFLILTYYFEVPELVYRDYYILRS